MSGASLYYDANGDISEEENHPSDRSTMFYDTQNSYIFVTSQEMQMFVVAAFLLALCLEFIVMLEVIKLLYKEFYKARGLCRMPCI